MPSILMTFYEFIKNKKEEMIPGNRGVDSGILPPNQIEQSLQMIQELEKIKKISEIIKNI